MACNSPQAGPNSESSTILEGVVAFVEVRSGHENRSKAISRELIRLGARVDEKFSKDVTHVVFREGRQSTVDRAKKNNIHLVSVLWVDSCKTKQEWMSESLYPSLTLDEHPLTPINVARLKKSKSMQPRDFDEEMSHSAEKLAAKKRRDKKKERPPRYQLAETPMHRRPFCFVEDSCPRSPGGSPLFSPSLVVPETPPSMKAKMDLLRAKMQQAANEYKESPVATGMSPSTPLQRRLFNSTRGAGSSQESDAPSSPLFLSGSSTTMFSGSKTDGSQSSLSSTLSPVVNHVVSLLESPKETTPKAHSISPVTRRSSSSRITSPDITPKANSRRQSSSGGKHAHVKSKLPANNEIVTPVIMPGHRFFGSPVFESDEKPKRTSSGKRSRKLRRSSNIAPEAVSGRLHLEDKIVDSDRRSHGSPRKSSEISNSRPTSATRKSPRLSKGKLEESSNRDANLDQSTPTITPTSSVELETVQKGVSRPKSRRSSVHTVQDNSIPASKSQASTNLSSSGNGMGKKKLLSLHASPSPVLILPGPKPNEVGSPVTETNRRKVSVKKRGKQTVTSTARDPSVLFMEASFDKKPKTSTFDSGSSKARGSKKRKADDRTSDEGFVSKKSRVGGSVSKPVEDCDAPVEQSSATTLPLVGQTNAAKLPPSNMGETIRRRSTRRSSIMTLKSIDEDTSMCFSLMDSQIPRLPPLTEERKPCSKLRRRSELLLPSHTVVDSGKKDASESQSSEPKSSVAKEAVNRRRSSALTELTANRRRSTRFVTITGENDTRSQSSNMNNSNALSGFSACDDSLTDVSALNTQNDTLPQSLGTRLVLQNVLCNVKDNKLTEDANTAKANEHEILANDSFFWSGADSENDEFAVTSRNSKRRSSIEKGRAINHNSTLMRSLAGTPISIREPDNTSSAVSPYASVLSMRSTDNTNTTTNTTPSLITPIRSRRSIDEFAPQSLSMSARSILSRTNENMNSKKKGKKKKEKTNKRHWKKVVIDHSPHTPPNRNFVLTSLHFDEQEIVHSVVERLGGFRIVDRVDDSTTHVLCGGPRRTLNVLNCIARGLWLISLSWVFESLEAGKWLPEDQYELDEYFPAAKLARLEWQQRGQSMNLFLSQGLIYVCESCRPPRKELSYLIKRCGGKVTTVVRKADICVGSVTKTDLPTVREQWVLDSITAKKTLPIDGYKLNSPPCTERAPSPDF